MQSNPANVPTGCTVLGHTAPFTGSLLFFDKDSLSFCIQPPRGTTDECTVEADLHRFRFGSLLYRHLVPTLWPSSRPVVDPAQSDLRWPVLLHAVDSGVIIRNL